MRGFPFHNKNMRGESVNWGVIREAQNSAYFSLFHGETARMSDIKRQSPQMEIATMTLIKTGKAVGQSCYLDSEGKINHDVIVWLGKLQVK